MHVTRLGNLDFTDMDAYHAVNNHLGATYIKLIPMDIVLRMLKHWRDYRRDGMKRSWILKEMYAKRINITSGAYTLTDPQIYGFVTALDRLEKGDVPVNPWERPDLAEAWREGPGKVFNPENAAMAAMTVALIIGGAIVLHGFAGGVARR